MSEETKKTRTAIDEMGRSVAALFLELPEDIADDVKAKWAAVYNIIEQLRDLLQQVYAQTENGYRVKTLTRIEIKECLDSFFTEE